MSSRSEARDVCPDDGGALQATLRDGKLVIFCAECHRAFPKLAAQMRRAAAGWREINRRAHGIEP